MNITLEAYNDLMRNYIKEQNKLQDIGFALEDYNSEKDCIKEIIEIWSRD